MCCIDLHIEKPGTNLVTDLWGVVQKRYLRPGWLLPACHSSLTLCSPLTLGTGDTDQQADRQAEMIRGGVGGGELRGVK